MLQELFKGFSRREEQEERQALMESMHAVQCALSRAYDGFNRADDTDLIDAYVYEINSLRSRYAYLLRQVRQLDGDPAVRP